MSTTFDSWETELYHHGILGQKWGRRRFQNEDGSLTEAGKARYGDISQMSDAEIKRAISRLNAERQLKEARRGGSGLRSAAKFAVKAATSYIEYKKEKAKNAADEKEKQREHDEKMAEFSTRKKEAESRVKEAAEKAKSQMSLTDQAKEKTKQDKANLSLYRTWSKRRETKAILKRAKTELSSNKKYKLIKKLVGDKDYKNSVEMLLGAKYDVKMTDARKSYYVDPNNFANPTLATVARADNQPKEDKESKKNDK